MMLPSAPLTSLRARRKNTGGLRRAIDGPSVVAGAPSTVVSGVMAATNGAVMVAQSVAGPPGVVAGARAVAPYVSSAPLPLKSSPVSSAPLGAPTADPGL